VARRGASPLSLNRPCSAPSPACGRSDLLGPVAVGVGDYFHHVTVGVVEIDAATAVQMIDLAGCGAPRIGVILDALSADAGERRVKFGVAYKEGGRGDLGAAPRSAWSGPIVPSSVDLTGQSSTKGQLPASNHY
jgi:hypothetical protein